MGYMIEIEKADMMELSEYLEKMLKYGGKAMSILDSACEEMKGHRMGRKSSRGYKEDEEYDDYGYPVERGMRRR